MTKKKLYILIIAVVIFLIITFFVIREILINKAIEDDDKKIIDSLHPKIKRKAKIFLFKAKKQGHNIRLTSGLRTFEEQNEIYSQGRTSGGSIVTNAKAGSSYHNYGLAFDIVDRDKGYNADWEELGKIGKKLGLEWGGSWKSFVDKPHFQLTKGYSTSELLSLYEQNKTDKNGYVKI